MNKDIKNVYFKEKDKKKKNLSHPDYYFDNVIQITPEFLQKEQIKALILDVDNTLIDKQKNLDKKIIEWSNNLKGHGYKLYILSNSDKVSKISNVANALDIKYQNFAKKPFKSGFLKLQKLIGEDTNKIAVVGDQIYTDIIGGNRVNMKTILVDPVDKNDYWYTAWKRPFEARLKKKLTKTKLDEKIK